MLLGEEWRENAWGSSRECLSHPCGSYLCTDLSRLLYFDVATVKVRSYLDI